MVRGVPMKVFVGLLILIGAGAGQGIRFELSAIRMASRYILGALARYRWRGARSGKLRHECQQARSGITVIAMSSFTAANPCRT